MNIPLYIFEQVSPSPGGCLEHPQPASEEVDKHRNKRNQHLGYKHLNPEAVSQKMHQQY
ncbi:hypothetical protein D3C76_1555740 [compost metagenome]